MSKIFTQYKIKLGRIAREMRMDICDNALSAEEFEGLTDMLTDIRIWLEKYNESED